MIKHSLVLTFVMALSAFAHAKLDSQLGKDEAGNPTLTVKNDSQQGLPPAQLGISPATVEGLMSIRSPRLDKSVTFYNYTNKPKELRLSLVDKDGVGSIKDWTLINPKNIIIPANGQQTIRLSFRPPKGVSVGDYGAILFIQQHIKDPISVSEEGVSMQIGSRYGLPISLTILEK
ncbi:MAG: hypothetical protein Q4B81_01020 [Moraxella sp.]|nr:hypothetical protein [Moraxella sp.]